MGKINTCLHSKITRNNSFYLYLTLCCKTTIVLEFDHENSAVNYDGAASWYSKKKSTCKSQATAQRKNLMFFFILFWYSTARLVSMNILADETAFGMHLSKYLFTQCSQRCAVQPAETLGIRRFLKLFTAKNCISPSAYLLEVSVIYCTRTRRM